MADNPTVGRLRKGDRLLLKNGVITTVVRVPLSFPWWASAVLCRHERWVLAWVHWEQMERRMDGG